MICWANLSEYTIITKAHTIGSFVERTTNIKEIAQPYRSIDSLVSINHELYSRSYDFLYKFESRVAYIRYFHTKNHSIIALLHSFNTNFRLHTYRYWSSVVLANVAFDIFDILLFHKELMQIRTKWQS